MKKKKEVKDVVVMPPIKPPELGLPRPDLIGLPEKRKEKKIAVRNRQTQEDFTPEAMIMKAIDKGSSVDTIEKLLNLRERLNKEKAEIALREAMTKFQSICPIIKKTKKVPNKDNKGTRYKYAPLEEIAKTIKPYMKECGLSYDVESSLVKIGEDWFVQDKVTIYHTLGAFKSSTFSTPIDKDAYMTKQQTFGSADSFSIRYALRNALGLVTAGDDDDGEGGDNPEEQKKIAEAIKKEREEIVAYIQALPDDIKEGFKLLGYADKNDYGKAAYLFCKGHKFDVEKIRAHQKLLQATS